MVCEEEVILSRENVSKKKIGLTIAKEIEFHFKEYDYLRKEIDICSTGQLTVLTLSIGFFSVLLVAASTLNSSIQTHVTQVWGWIFGLIFPVLFLCLYSYYIHLSIKATKVGKHLKKKEKIINSVAERKLITWENHLYKGKIASMYDSFSIMGINILALTISLILSGFTNHLITRFLFYFILSPYTFVVCKNILPKVINSHKKRPQWLNYNFHKYNAMLFLIAYIFFIEFFIFKWMTKANSLLSVFN